MTRRGLRLSFVCCLAMVAGLMAARTAGAAGTFAPAQNYAAFQQPTGLVSGDFNGDGNVDLVTAHPYGVDFFAGNGLGQFGSQPSNFMMPGSATGLASGDFNGDGRLDVVLSTTSGLQVGNGTGGGTFLQGSLLLAGTNFSGVAAGDLDGDGRIDAVASISSTSQVVVFPGNPMGLMVGLAFPTGAFPQSVTLARVDTGPTLDVVTANASSSVSVLLGNGMGFGPPMTTGVAAPAYAVRAENLNGDAYLDLAAVGYGMMGPSGVTVLIGNGTGSLLSIGTFTAGYQPHDLDLADVNADSKVDVVVANLASNDVSVMFGTGSGSFGPPTNYGVGANPFSILARDVNASGTIDIATVNLTSKDLSILLNSTVPSAPLNLTANPGPSQGQITLNWSPPADDGGSPVQYYNIYRSTLPGNEVLVFIGVPGTTWTDYGLSNGTTYYYTVSARNVVGEGPTSNEASATTFGPPTPPQNLVAAPGSAVGEVKLTWQAPVSDGGQPVTGWVVCRGTTPGVHPFCGTLPANATSYSDGGLLPLTSYYYELHAVNSLGQSGASNEACAKPFPWVSALGC